MFKKTLLLASTLILAHTPANAGGISSISENGSVSGKTAYKIECTNGKTWRIWRSSDQWWDGRGAQGGQYRDLNEQATFLCG